MKKGEEGKSEKLGVREVGKGEVLWGKNLEFGSGRSDLTVI